MPTSFISHYDEQVCFTTTYSLLLHGSHQIGNTEVIEDQRRLARAPRFAEKAKVQEQSSLEKSNEGELSNTRSEIMALELEVKETEVYTATQKETLSAKREHNTIVIKQMNEVSAPVCG